MPTKTLQSFKHIFRICFLLPAVLTGSGALADKSRVDLLAAGKRAWDSVDATWNIDQGEIAGVTRIKNGAITDPAASTFLVSKAIFGGDIVVSMDVTFETGRYLGVYLDFGQDTQTGIWMATGHALAEDAAANEVERAYIKTVRSSARTSRPLRTLSGSSAQRGSFLYSLVCHCICDSQERATTTASSMATHLWSLTGNRADIPPGHYRFGSRMRARAFSDWTD
jgi:hypothetical protein